VSTTLPPVPSEKALSAALDGFVAALGPAAVLTSQAEFAEFRDPFAYATWDDYTASAVVKPTTVEGIQEVLRIANEHKVPLWTHGQGRNNGHGGPAPRVRGAVISSTRFMSTIKDALDPNGILSPGKQGIWPKGMRDRRGS
jgi:4-cresol dehydrogenase (hydroxylating) flavoprotein subunit